MSVSTLSTKREEVHSHLIIPHVSLADKNWFKTGGHAEFFAEPATAQEFQEVLKAAHGLPIGLIGEGANMLISDTGLKGLVLRPGLKAISLERKDSSYGYVRAEAGVSFGELISWCLKKGLSGLEEFSGIPGTVGGAVFINIHYFEFLLSQFLVEAHVIEKSTGTISTVDNAWFNFGYNSSRLHEGNHYLLSATFKLKQVDSTVAAYAQGRSNEMIRHRAMRYPTAGTCGSFFRNFSEDEVKDTRKKLIFVAYYLDKVGIKGELAVGGAQVSHKHANMIVNTGHATTQDIVSLARTMQELVHAEFGIIPQPECRLIGFQDYPLHKVL